MLANVILPGCITQPCLSSIYTQACHSAKLTFLLSNLILNLLFSACTGEVVEGLDAAILKVNEDEVFEVTVAPEYGYGDKEEHRSLGTVPPNSTLHYTVELLEVTKVRIWSHLFIFSQSNHTDTLKQFVACFTAIHSWVGLYKKKECIDC